MSKPRTSRAIYSGKYLRLVTRDGWEFIERVNCTGVVIILAVTDDQRILFVEQFRYPVQKPVIGFPAGLVGDSHGKRRETSASAAKRELIEETGYSARKIRTLFVGPVSAGMCKDMVTMVAAQGLTRVSAGGGVGDENIRVHEVPLAKVDQWLARQSRRDVLIGPNVFAGLYLLRRELALKKRKPVSAKVTR